MAISDWPAGERPREKLLRHGAESLSDAELLAIFLRTGVPGRSALALARHLIAEFGSLGRLLSAPQHEFCAVPGLGPAKYAQLQAVRTMALRARHHSLTHGRALTNPQHARQAIQERLGDQPYETFCTLWLDTRNRVIAFDELFRGTLATASVYPREVVRTALRHNAAAVILAHNHPSGVAEPSQADRQLTERLRTALGLVDIRVLDHIVVSDRETVCFSERGWL